MEPYPSHVAIELWLAKVACNVNPAPPIVDALCPSPTAVPLTASDQPLTPPQSTSSFQTRKRTYDTACGMESDDASAHVSVALSDQESLTPHSIISNRPILQPKPPSQRSRSSSPTRKLLALLEHATPPIKCCQPGNAVTQPHEVATLRSRLVRGWGEGIIPRGLADKLRDTDLDGFDEIPRTAFYDETESQATLDSLWQTVHAVYIEAERCQNDHKDESAWVEVVRAVLRASGCSSGILEMNSIQTQQIDPTLLSVLPRGSVPFAKKADLALAFSPHNDITELGIRNFAQSYPGVSLSQMQDAYTSTVPLVCGFEVKETGGNYNEAVMQLGIWSAAGLEKIRQLKLGRSTAHLQPFIGWTVIGHEWKLHLAWKEQNGQVYVLGPWKPLTAGTANYHDIFLLLDILRRTHNWLTEEYWPWLVQEVLS